jgi:ResB-like family
MTTAGSFDRELRGAARSTTQAVTIRGVLLGVLEHLGSLKLTVGLLVLAVFIIWVASLQQTRTDIWAVKAQHFSSPVVCIPFSIFFPPAWFPQLQSLQGNCYLPSGITVLVAMIINLLAAHLVRMRIQASGSRLIAGIIVGAMGFAVTWVVVFSAQDPDGFQGSTSPEFFRRLWYVIHAALLGVGIASAVASYRMASERTMGKIAMGFFAALMLAGFVLLLVLGERAFIGDSAMRILWQLIQGTMAASVMMIASMLLFKRKGAVVLIHIGILMLMVNEVYVSLTNHEQQMYIAEGETSSVAVDIRSSEMVVVDSSTPEDTKVTSIPSTMMQKGELITDLSLPFDLKCSRFFINADLTRIDASSKPENNANTGVGKVFEAVELPPTPAIGSERKNDRPAAYVELFKKGTNESLGKFLISMLAFDNEVLDSVTVDGKTYQIGMRHKTTVKPYEVQLLDAEKTTYPGTSIPKSFASDLLLTDRDRGLIESPQRVWMNNPLRYGNETFYQSGMDELNGREYTVLQIVKNSGWMIPYVACMFVVLGLVVQFGTTLEKMVQTKSAAAEEKVEPTNRLVLYGLAAVVGLALVPYAAGEIYKGLRPNVKFAEMRLDKFGLEILPANYRDGKTC